VNRWTRIRRVALAVGLALLLALFSCATLRNKEGSQGVHRGRVWDAILFPHDTHVDQEVECLTCHAGADKSGSLKIRHSPTKKVCADCHEVEDKKECVKCHRKSASARPLAARLHFSHKDHQGRTKECLDCHAGAAVAPTLAKVQRPRMRQDCFRCHNHLQQYRRLRCKVCHHSLSQYPLNSISAFNHEGDFLKEHKRWGRSNGDLCGTCHGQSFCADCHTSRGLKRPSVRLAERGDRAFIHRGDWISRHAPASRADPGQCSRCHSPKACARCHRASGISASASGSRSPHPAGWLSPASPNSHGQQARQRIAQCASCHDRGTLTNCVRCHKSAARGGLGLRPHPPGWNRGGKQSDKVCLYCH